MDEHLEKLRKEEERRALEAERSRKDKFDLYQEILTKLIVSLHEEKNNVSDKYQFSVNCLGTVFELAEFKNVEDGTPEMKALEFCEKVKAKRDFEQRAYGAIINLLGNIRLDMAKGIYNGWHDYERLNVKK